MADGGAPPKIGEFMTAWEGFARPGLQAWSTRQRSALIGSVKSTRYQPKFRPFDFLDGPNKQVAFLENDDHRIGVEAVVGTQDCFKRFIDTDMIYFQFCGRTTVETEFGVYEQAAGEVMLVPAGIAHRSTGYDDSLRYYCRAHTPIGHVRGEETYTSETAFKVSRSGGPDWSNVANPGPPPAGKVIERMYCWDDGPDDEIVAERDYDFLVGASTLNPREPVSGIRKIRGFDFFEEVVGKSGGEPFPIMSSEKLLVRTYNIVGEQFAFHRALRSEEVRLQFRGNATEISEYEEDPIRPGEVTIVPRGIAHSVITDPPEDRTFLRLNFYSALPWRVPRDLTQHVSDSHFAVETDVIREADWRAGIAAE